MDELVQDLASALEESELKQDIDDLGDVSATSPRLDRELYRKRRTRKRRTASTSSHLVSSLLSNLAVANQINNSPRSSSSLDEAVKDYVESLTANCSDESDEYVNSLKNRLKNAVLSNNLQVRGHHRRVFKQATPCCCESDSFTENGTSLPVLRRHKKKKIKRMTIDSSCNTDSLLQSSPTLTSQTGDSSKKKKKATQGSPPQLVEEKMRCKTTKLKKERRTILACLLCSRKACDKSQGDTGSKNGLNTSSKNEASLCTAAEVAAQCKHEDQQGCQCRCHSSHPKDESSISSTSSNSDTDSANFTQDDVGGEGDDEMTDFYAESENGPVWGVPNVCRMHWYAHGRVSNNTNDDNALWLQVEESELNCGSNIYDTRMKRFVSGTLHLSDCSRRGFHARNNRLPGMAARSVRRGRRRAKMKKSKEKSAREQELLEFHSSLSKLSLSARTKRRKLEDNFWRDAFNNRSDWSGHRLLHTLPIPESTMVKKNDVHTSKGSDLSTGQSHQSAASTSSAIEAKRRF